MEIFPILVLAFELYIVFTVIVLLLDNREPSETFAWIFIFILLPGLGFIVYLFTGRNWKKGYDHKRKLPQYIAKNLITLFKPIDDAQAGLIKMMANRSKLNNDDLMTLLYFIMVVTPISTPSQPSFISMPFVISTFALGSTLSAIIWSIGNRNCILPVFFIKSFAKSNLSSSTKDLPTGIPCDFRNV